MSYESCESCAFEPQATETCFHPNKRAAPSTSFHLAEDPVINEQQAIVVVPPDLSTFNREMTLANKSNQYNVLASDHIDFCSCSVEAALKFNPAGRSKLIIIRTYYIVCIHIYIYVYTSSTGVSARLNALGWSFSFCNALISCKQPSWQQAKV